MRLNPIKVIIANRNEIVRFGLRTWLSSTKNITVVGEAARHTEIPELLKEQPVDMILFGVSTTPETAFMRAKYVKTRFPEVKMVIMSMLREFNLMNEAIECGADGYVSHDVSCKDLLETIEIVRYSNCFFSKTLNKKQSKTYKMTKPLF